MTATETITATDWRYAPEGDSDGYAVGTDHVVMDADGNQVCLARDEREGRLIGAAPRMLATLEAVLPWLERMDVLRHISGAADFPLLDMTRETLALARGE